MTTHEFLESLMYGILGGLVGAALVIGAMACAMWLAKRISDL
jgi:uncharacterized membrane protein